MNVDRDKIYVKQRLQFWKMGLLGCLVGILTACGSVVFQFLLSLSHNLAFLGKFSWHYLPTEHTPVGSLGMWIILSPVAGAVIVVTLIKFFSPDSKGHGVGEVRNAIYYKKGKISLSTGIVKIVASAISIGSGASSGPEGPLVQAGSAFASFVGRKLNLTQTELNILIGAGAAAGISTCFNSPLTGLAFSIELILTTVNSTSLFTVIAAVVVATRFFRFINGNLPIFYLPDLFRFDFKAIPISELIVFVGFGVIVGLCAILFIYILVKGEEIFEGYIQNYYLRHIIGMLIIGIIMYCMFISTGYHYVEGLGISSIYDAFSSAITNPYFLLFLVLLKIVATSITLGSGGSGGTFTPLIYCGALLGVAVSNGINIIYPGLHLDPFIFALAGVAGIVASATGALLTGMLLAVELFSNTNYALPILLTAAVAYAVRKSFAFDGLYSISMRKKGLFAPEGLQAAITSSIEARHIASKEFRIYPFIKAVNAMKGGKKSNSPDYIILSNEGSIRGIINWKKDCLVTSTRDIAKYIDTKYLIVDITTSYPEMVQEMNKNQLDYILVSRTHGSIKAVSIKGVITKKEILNSVNDVTSYLI